MARLSTQAIVRVWEAGLATPPIARALVVLGAAFPDLTPDAIESLPLGTRDEHLFQVRESTFGPVLHAHAACPECGERVEFELTARDVLDCSERRFSDPGANPGAVSNNCSGEADQRDPDRLHVRSGEFDVRFRVLTSRDLLALADVPSAETGKALARRSVEQATRQGQAVDAGEVPDEILAVVGEQIGAADPNADVTLNLTCPRCDSMWNAPFDIASFLWSEIAAEAQRLIAQVHVLGRAYGWREADVLGMSAVRRQAYLNLVGQ